MPHCLGLASQGTAQGGKRRGSVGDRPLVTLGEHVVGDHGELVRCAVRREHGQRTSVPTGRLSRQVGEVLAALVGPGCWRGARGVGPLQAFEAQSSQATQHPVELTLELRPRLVVLDQHVTMTPERAATRR